MKTAATGSRQRENIPGPLYVDASAVVKLYAPEPGSEELNGLVLGRGDLLVSNLALTEVMSSLCRRRREGSLSTQGVLSIQRAMLAHMEQGYYQRADLDPATHRDAERLLLSVETVPLRAADALHLALAVRAKAASVLTYDIRLGTAARAIGLSVFP